MGIYVKMTGPIMDSRQEMIKIRIDGREWLNLIRKKTSLEAKKREKFRIIYV